MTATRRSRLLLVIAAALIMSGASVCAQTASQGPPNALQGFSQNRDQPVHIEAATLEVRDKQKEATFSGDVRVKQGDTGMRCKSLVVFYEQGGIPWSRRRTTHQAAGSSRRGGGHAEGSNRHWRTRHL